jgi:hypothetical protein
LQLLYVKQHRTASPECPRCWNQIRADAAVSYKAFSTADELEGLLVDDLRWVLTNMRSRLQPSMQSPTADELTVQRADSDELSDAADPVRSSAQQPGAEPSTTDAALTATPAFVAPAASAQLPGYDADAVAQEDFIGVKEVVDAFSYLIVGRTIEPPFAVGLFGRSGSGKTFLMRAIQRRVNNITRVARESRRQRQDEQTTRRECNRHRLSPLRRCRLRPPPQ